MTLYRKPRSHRIIGKVKAGTVVTAVLGERIVVRPLHFIAARDFQVGTGFYSGEAHTAKGDVFWLLNLAGEGEFSIWWHCKVVGWDSTEATQDDPNRLDLLGGNEESWVKIRDSET